MYLVGTAEVPLAAYHSDEILDAATLPRRYVGWSPSYRREAGSHGKDTRGIWRVHWFDKVEMFSYCAPEDAVAEHAQLLSLERQMLDSLELPYRVIDVASGDLGARPRASSTSRRGSRRRATTARSPRPRTAPSSRPAASRCACATRTACARSPRSTAPWSRSRAIIVALLENHQQADGSVHVPVALRPYLGGRETPHAARLSVAASGNGATGDGSRRGMIRGVSIDDPAHPGPARRPARPAPRPRARHRRAAAGAGRVRRPGAARLRRPDRRAAPRPRAARLPRAAGARRPLGQPVAAAPRGAPRDRRDRRLRQLPRAAGRDRHGRDRLHGRRGAPRPRVRHRGGADPLVVRRRRTPTSARCARRSSRTTPPPCTSSRRRASCTSASRSTRRTASS